MKIFLGNEARMFQEQVEGFIENELLINPLFKEFKLELDESIFDDCYIECENLVKAEIMLYKINVLIERLKIGFEEDKYDHYLNSDDYNFMLDPITFN